MNAIANNLSDLDELDRFEQAVQAFQSGQLDAERFMTIRLQLGVYGQRQQGVHMLRTKIPGGRLTPEQLEAFADAAENYSQRSIAHVTTRQSIQLHFVPLANAPAAMRRMAQVGMTSREACNNTLRNMSACALAGVCPREHVNIRTHLDGAVRHFLRNPLNQQLPRKFKISFSACEADCAQAMVHDAAVVAIRKDDQPGFMVKACGGLGHKPREAIVVEQFIPESELLFSLEALVSLHNKYSDRTKRAKSRVKFLIDRFGAEGFVEKYREEFARTRQALAGRAYPQGGWRTPSGTDIPGPGAPRRLFAQHQDGLFVLPISVPNGDLTVPQLRGIAQLLRAQGLNEVNTTQDQNLIVLNVTQKQVAILREGLAALGLHEPVAGDNVVSCPGNSTCRLGITSSYKVAPTLSGGPADLRIRVSGCHNGCAQPETGDIGIYGEGKRLHGKLVPHYQMYLGGDGTMGGTGTGHGALALKGPLVPAVRIAQAITRVEQAHQDSGGKSFFAWAHAQQPDYFKQLLADIIEVKAEDVASVMRDHGDSSDFRVVNLGGGECSGVTQVMIGANFFEAAHERDYRNALMFQRQYSDAAHCSASILRLLGAGLAQLLGEERNEDLASIAAQLNRLIPGKLSGEFARLVTLLGTAEMTDAAMETINQAVDVWTVDAGAFCTTLDRQLDLSEALPRVAGRTGKTLVKQFAARKDAAQDCRELT